MTYANLQAFAQTWGLLFLVALFIVALTYALWPANKARFDAAARLPLENDVLNDKDGQDSEEDRNRD